MGAEIAKFARRGWEREPVVFISCVMGGIAPILVVISPSSQRTFKDIRDFPKEYPWPETRDQRRKPVLELKMEDQPQSEIQKFLHKQIEDDLY